MIVDVRTARALYRKLLALYPRAFRDRLGDSMEQTFQDLWNEKRGSRRALLGTVCWIFIETALGIVKEHLLLLSAGSRMKSLAATAGLSALIGLLFILPLMLMEVINRRNLYEAFPAMLFFVMWLNLFTISLILLPIVRASRMGATGLASTGSAQGGTLASSPRSAAIVSIVVFLAPALLPLLDSLGWVSLNRLLNGPNPEQQYLPGQIITLMSFSLPIAAGMIASGPIIRTLRGGGRLFAHPLNLFIVTCIMSIIAMGLAGIIIDQWPCFTGVPACD